ncbi:Uncharacterised protein [Vibrio cholerae]|nr:Uncharacterised protein [Vibrio cholerae]
MSKPVKQRFFHSIGRRAQSFGIMHGQFSAAPQTADNPNLPCRGLFL